MVKDRAKRLEQCKRLIKAFADPCRGVIYHYTSAEGLKGIIENSEIWLTNAVFVNDTTECKALQEEKDLFDERDFSNEHVRDKWKYFINSPDKENNIYIASFSSGKESLGQWRAYGNFRIGFKAKDLIKRPFNLYKCIYSKKEIKEWLLKKGRIKEWNGNSLDDQSKRVAAFNLIYAASKKYKNKHFKEEREVRLVVISNHTRGFYPNSSSMFENEPPIYYRNHYIYEMPVPYVKFFIGNKREEENDKKDEAKETHRQMKERKLNDEKNVKRELLPIAEVLIGPMPHQKEAEIACKILLKDNGYEDVKVNVSKIPYRGF